MGAEENKILINVGSLDSLASVYSNVSSGLNEFNQAWKKGQGADAEVTWDLRDIRNGGISIDAIAFFLAIAQRVRKFTGTSQSLLIDWNPKVLGFLYDIRFFDISDAYDLFSWPYDVGGYDTGKINPNTMLLAFKSSGSLPDLNDSTEVSEWKKSSRESCREYIVDMCEALFSPRDERLLGKGFALAMSRTCAEIATNSLLWGKTDAFLGLQRTSKRISINVSDLGVGFKNSFISKGQFCDQLVGEYADVHSIALGCIYNQNDFGLKRAISSVIDLGGTIWITSNSAEIYWNKSLWERFVSAFEIGGFDSALASLPNSIFKASDLDRKDGYVRKWRYPIRGSRVSFCIPIAYDQE